MLPLPIETWLAAALPHPGLIVLALITASFILEDAATVAAGFLASQMLLDPWLAVSALVVGTIVGDLGLYGAGRLAVRTAWAARLRCSPPGRRAAGWLAANAVTALVAARFVPGTRLPVYTTSGFLGLPALTVTIIVTAASLVWTPGLFLIAARAGAGAAAAFGEAAPVIGIAAVGGAVLLPRVARRWRAA